MVGTDGTERGVGTFYTLEAYYQHSIDCRNLDRDCRELLMVASARQVCMLTGCLHQVIEQTEDQAECRRRVSRWYMTT